MSKTWKDTPYSNRRKKDKRRREKVRREADLVRTLTDVRGYNNPRRTK